MESCGKMKMNMNMLYCGCGIKSSSSSSSSWLFIDRLLESSSSSSRYGNGRKHHILASFKPNPNLHGRDDSDSDEDEDGGVGSEKTRSPLSHNHRHLSLSPLSKDTAMGLVLSAAAGKGWTTGSGMEGPPEPAGDADSSAAKISTFPWSLFTKSPRRRMLIAFTCNICTQRTTRAINPHAYTDGTVFVQCCGCNAYHKLVDNLNLFDGMKCYITSSFKYGGNGADVNFEYEDIEDDGDGLLGM